MRDDGGLGLVDARRARAARAHGRRSTPALERAPEPSCATSTRRASTSACCPRCPGVEPRLPPRRAAPVAALVAKGDADAAVLLRAGHASPRSAPRPPRGVRMPQKTTFFAPKPRTGMVFRSLDD